MLGSLGLLLFLVAVTVALRLYFNDDRLREMGVAWVAERSGAPTDLQALEISLLSGVELRGLRIGPLPGFSRDTLAVDRLAVHWSGWELLRLRVILDELALERPRLVLEENAQGRNLDLLLARLLPPKPETAPPPPAPPPGEEPTPLAQPSVPVHVELRRLALINAQAEVLQPGLSLAIDQVNLEGKIEAEGQALALDLWLGLGERATTGHSSRLRFTRAEPAADLDGEQRFGIHVTSSGLGDIAVDLSLDSRTNVRQPLALPPVAAHGKLVVTADLLRQQATVSQCSFGVGERTLFELVAAAEHILAASPDLSVSKLQLAADFDELGPLIAAAAPGTALAGQLGLEMTPFASSVAALTNKELPPTELRLLFTKLGVVTGSTRLLGLDGKLTVVTPAEVRVRAAQAHAHAEAQAEAEAQAQRQAQMQTAAQASDQTAAQAATAAPASDDVGAEIKLAVTVAHLASAGQEVDKLGLDIAATTPLAPFLGGPAQGILDARILLDAGVAGADAARAKRLHLDLTAKAPLTLVLGKAAAGPPEAIEARLALTAGDVVTPTAVLNGVDLGVTARLWDLAGARLVADAKLSLAELLYKHKDALIRLPDVALALALDRNRDSYVIDKLDLGVTDLLRLHLGGGAFDTSSTTPRFDKLALTIDAPRLDGLLSLVPASMLPPMILTGGLHIGVDVDGTVPHAELAAQAQPPDVSLAEGRNTWAQAVQAYADFLHAWAARFNGGIPFTASLRIGLSGVSMRDAANDVRGVDADILAALGQHGPHLRLDVGVGEVVRPTPASKVKLVLDFTADGEGMALGVDVGSASLTLAPLTQPLRDLTAEIKARYKLGGDFVLDRLGVAVPERGLVVDMSGVVNKPLQLVMERGWERAGMPGVDAAIKLVLANGVPDGGAAPITINGPVLGGKIGLAGDLRVVKGLITLTGKLDADRFIYEAGKTGVEEMSGALPFDIRLVAGTRKDAFIIARNAGLGGGVLSLVVSPDDIRNRPPRPAYYDRVRTYRQHAGLFIKKYRQDPYEIDDLLLDARIEEGMFLADSIAMKLLGGDIAGSLGVQIGLDAFLRGDLRLQISGLDASHFLKMASGADSEINTDMDIGFVFGPEGRRDIPMDFNITRIGLEAFDRLLLMLMTGDPETDKSLISTRDSLGWVTINKVAIWVRYENLNMDLDYTTKLRIPWTKVGYYPIPGELLRRQSIAQYLDVYVQPYIEKYVAPYLGWNYVQ